jgi:hypothetical protein
MRLRRSGLQPRLLQLPALLNIAAIAFTKRSYGWSGKSQLPDKKILRDNLEGFFW